MGSREKGCCDTERCCDEYDSDRGCCDRHDNRKERCCDEYDSDRGCCARHDEYDSDCFPGNDSGPVADLFSRGPRHSSRCGNLRRRSFKEAADDTLRYLLRNLWCIRRRDHKEAWARDNTGSYQIRFCYNTRRVYLWNRDLRIDLRGMTPYQFKVLLSLRTHGLTNGRIDGMSNGPPIGGS